MKFFDNKEEVLDIELTPYGEALLSQGKFKPTYYAFFDEDVLYDASGSAGVLEAQNDIEPRIQSNTPKLKAQYLFSGVESNLAPEIIASRQEDAPRELIQNSKDRNFVFVEPIGTMELGSEEAPSWNVQVLKGELTGAINYLTSSATSGRENNVLRIPQLDFEVTYRAAVGNVEEFDLDNPDFVNRIISRQYANGTFVYLKEDRPELIFSIDEDNATNDTDYEIEVFLVESGSAGPESQLTPLSFQRETQRVVNDILIDEPEGRRQRRQSFRLDATYAEYFFNVNTDLEIPEEVMCPLIQDLRTRGVEVDDIPYDCPDVSPVARVNIYNTDVVGEECE